LEFDVQFGTYNLVSYCKSNLSADNNCNILMTDSDRSPHETHKILNLNLIKNNLLIFNLTMKPDQNYKFIQKDY